jgi:hypothetical protein
MPFSMGMRQLKSKVYHDTKSLFYIPAFQAFKIRKALPYLFALILNGWPLLLSG